MAGSLTVLSAHRPVGRASGRAAGKVSGRVPFLPRRRAQKSAISVEIDVSDKAPCLS